MPNAAEVGASDPCRRSTKADRLTIVTANTSGSSTPDRDDVAQPGSPASSSAVAATAPDTSPGGSPAVTVSLPRLGSIFHRIPVHNVSPVIEGGAYPAKAVVGESVPIRATVFREGHDAVNASVVLTDPEGNERHEPMRPTTPLGLRLVDGISGARLRGNVDVPRRGLERSVGNLGPPRRDQDSGWHRCRVGVHRGHRLV